MASYEVEGVGAVEIPDDVPWDVTVVDGQITERHIAFTKADTGERIEISEELASPEPFDPEAQRVAVESFDRVSLDDVEVS